MTKCVEPGLYENLPAQEYHNMDAPSKSWLEKIVPPASLIGYLGKRGGEEEKEAKALVFGRQIHELVFEEKLFKKKYVEEPYFGDGRLAATKKLKADFALENAGRETISERDWSDLMGIRDSLVSHPYARAFLWESPGVNELSGVYDHIGQGVRTRFRADRVLNNGIVIDLKTTRCSHPDVFKRDLGSYGYHRQAAHYLDGLRANGRDDCQAFVFVVVEKKRVIDDGTREDAVAIGRRDFEKRLSVYKECRAKNEWPAWHDPGIIDITLTEYELRKNEYEQPTDE